MYLCIYKSCYSRMIILMLIVIIVAFDTITDDKVKFSINPWLKTTMILMMTVMMLMKFQFS